MDKTTTLPRLRRLVALLAALSVATTASAQTLSFAQTPLYLATTVKPNVLVMYDNSQSMEAVMPGGWRTTFDDANTRGNIARQVLEELLK